MRDFPIAYGTSRSAKNYKNSSTSFEALCERLSNTVRTTETAEEYAKMPKTERDNIKDKGGFVAGILKGGRRKQDDIESRSMLTQDVDEADADFLERYEMLFPYESCIYSTHGHTKEAPRYRVITPLTRDVSPEEYAALSRFIAAELGIDCFDPCSFLPNQLMYWPTTPSNGEFVYRHLEGELLNPDEIFAKHPYWRDCSRLPMTSKESMIKEPNRKKKQQNPAEKKGVVGAFCEAMGGISGVIDKCLSDVYRPSATAGRYDFINGQSTAGLVVYDNDTFAYSHHATDPAYQKELNAFDLVRVHRFPDEDEKKSFKLMADYAVTLDEVKLYLAKERMAQADEEFGDSDWQTALEIDRQGKVKDTLDNLVLILRHDEGLGNIAFNCHRDGIDAKGGLPWEQIKAGWNDSDNAGLKVYLSNHYGIYAPTKTKDALLAVAAERAYHPIKEYLKNLPAWDGVPRVETLFIDYFGADDTTYTKAVSRKSMVAAVARIYVPGTKFDSVPILNGPQGIGKSTFYAKLAGDWFSDSLTLTDMKDKSGPEKLQGYWILELGELAGMRKTDVETVKSFISRTDDKYRASYGVNVESHPRQCIIVGSTNAESGFLRDITGNRRFWPIRVHGNGKKKAWQLSKAEVDQIWAETLVLYQKGEKLYLEGEDAQLAVNEQADAMETDEREGLVREYLDTLLPKNWSDLGIYERRNYLSGNEFGGKPNGTEQRQYVCNMEIWCECFGRDGASMKPADSYAIAAIMRKIENWEKTERTTFAIYGRQRGYKRKLSK
jgi:predicted P-loop ATPase